MQTTAQPRFLLANALPDGEHAVTVRLRHAAGEERWTGEIRVGAELTAEVDEMAGHTLPEFRPTPATSSGRSAYVLAAAVLIVALVGVLGRWRIRLARAARA